MNYDIFTNTFPVLEGYNIRLRPIAHDDIESLFYLLQDPAVIKEYWAHSEAPTFRETQSIYERNPQINFLNKKSITWAIALEENNQIIGIRDLFVDDKYKSITVQGFIKAEYRKQGISKEAYNLIIDFVKQYNTVGLLANTSAENIAAISLLSSVGFSTEHVDYKGDDLRIVVKHNLQEYERPLFWTDEEKKIYTFCKMYLQGEDIEIAPDGTIQRDDSVWPCYRVKTYAKNTFGRRVSSVYHAEIEFVSDGVVIMDLNSSGWICYIDGRVPLGSAVSYCWDRCAIEKY